MEFLVRFFPLLAVLALVVIGFLALRLDRRMSRSAYSAGPIDVPRPKPVGQEPTPWELQAIDDQLRLVINHGSAAVPRYDLTATVNRLVAAAGLSDKGAQLPITANEAQLAAAIAQIEHRLELPPLTEGMYHR